MNTQSTDCRKVADYDAMEKPGDFYFSEIHGLKRIHIILPDGSHNALPISLQNEKSPGAAWQWDGNKEKPTLHPSIHCIDHWHGWLKAGRLESC